MRKFQRSLINNYTILVCICVLLPLFLQLCVADENDINEVISSPDALFLAWKYFFDTHVNTLINYFNISSFLEESNSSVWAGVSGRRPTIQQFKTLRPGLCHLGAFNPHCFVERNFHLFGDWPSKYILSSWNQPSSKPKRYVEVGGSC